MTPTEGRPMTPPPPALPSEPRGPGRRPARRSAVLAIAIVLAIALLSAALVIVGGRDPTSLRAKAERLIQQGELDRAERVLDRLQTIASPTSEDQILLARLALERGHSEEARASLRMVPDDHPTIAVAWLRTGQTELRSSRFRQAERALLEALRIDPTIDPARRELIYIYGYQLRREAARDQFLALADPMRLTPSEVLVWCLLRSTTWSPEEAASTLGRAVEADPEDRWSRLALVRNLIALVRLDEADRLLEALPAPDPEAIALRVELALERSDVAEAEALLDGAPEDHPGLDYVRGRLALARGRMIEARNALQSALAAGPIDEEKILRNLAIALRRLGEPLHADRLIARADALRRLNEMVSRILGSDSPSDDGAIFRRLGEACMAARLPHEARAWYQLSLARDPLDDHAQKAIAEAEAAIAQDDRLADD